ncbi:MAG: hypothetical protein L3J74_10405 [Bacteroidales bacterium]|nr:hypothetical protein [Bacteroidales bacterium]
MLELKGIYENGQIKFDGSVKIDKRMRVIVRFIEEDYEQDQENEKHVSIDKVREVQKRKYSKLPILWTYEQTDINDFAGIFNKENMNAELLRNSAWKRSW